MKIPLLDLKPQYQEIRKEIDQALRAVMESQQFILGPNVRGLEAEVARYCGAEHAVGVTSGSDALLIALMALEIGPGCEVITSPYSFFASAGCIARLGAKPIFVDIDPRTYNINPELIEEKITKKTKALIPVHLYGQCADVTRIMEIARRHKLAVVEDAAQAIGAEHRSKRAGSFGTMGTISFFPSKNLGAFGDGGMVTTNDGNIAARLRKLRMHGSADAYYYDEIGGNFRLDELQAAVLRVKLRRLDKWTGKRCENALRYDALFRDRAMTRDVVLPTTAKGNVHVFNQYVIRLKNRDAVKAALADQEIGTAIYYPKPLHLQKCFAYRGYKEGDFPEAERASKETLALPIYPEVGERAQRIVVDAIRRCSR